MVGGVAKRTIIVEGPKVERLRNRLALTQRELGDKIGMTERNVSRIESESEAGIYPESFRRLAEVAGVEIPKLREMIGSKEETKAFDANVEPYSESKIPAIPTFELPLAAGDWMDVSTDLCEDRTVREHGLFRVRLRGESMDPVYPDGTLVEFRCLVPSVEGPIEGKDYYVQRSDGTATFKRVAKIEEDTITLQALNKKVMPKFIVVPRQEITRMAVAEHKLDRSGMHGEGGSNGHKKRR
jgi:transcriptional regulator with XRE-family HTH domain